MAKVNFLKPRKSRPAHGEQAFDGCAEIIFFPEEIEPEEPGIGLLSESTATTLLLQGVWSFSVLTAVSDPWYGNFR